MNNGTRVKGGAGRGADQEAAVLAWRWNLDDFLAEVEEVGWKRLDLFHQPVDQLLGAADRQGRNVVNRLFRVQLRALSAGILERIDQVGLDAEQTELEHLEQSAGTGADNDHLGGDRLSGDRSRIFAQNRYFQAKTGGLL